MLRFCLFVFIRKLIGNFFYLFLIYTSRRNKPGDRTKALHVIGLELNNRECDIDMVCLYGTIYKDQLVESFFVDTPALENAIYWYRKAFEMRPNEYTGINLATLLVIDGNEFYKSKELQHIGTSRYSKNISET